MDGFVTGDVSEVFDGECFAIERNVDARALMDCGQKCRAVFANAAALDADEAGEVFVFGAEAVADPCAHGRTDFREGAGVELEGGAGVLRIVGAHATEEADIVGDRREMGHEIGDHHAALAARFDGGHGFEGEKLFGPDLGDFFAQRRLDGLTVHSVDVLLWIEEIHLRGAAAHEEENDAFGFWLERSGFDGERVGCGGCAGEVVQREGSETARGGAEKMAPSESGQVNRVHGMRDGGRVRGGRRTHWTRGGCGIARSNLRWGWVYFRRFRGGIEGRRGRRFVRLG